MKGIVITRSNLKVRITWLGTTLGFGMLFLVILLWSLQGVTPVNADPGTLYVDGTTGQDISSCGTMDTPCKTISYALNTRANSGDTIRVAQGVYTENITIDKQITLEGGYEPTGWARDIAQYTTVIDGSDSSTIWGDWDGSHIGSPVIISTGTIFEMWYDGRSLTGYVQLGRAISSDGINWTKDTQNPLFSSGASGSWDYGNIWEPFILLDGGIYKMWYTSDDNAIGYAISTDGINWTRYPTPVLEGGPAGAWDEGGVSDPYVIKVNGTYTMWYESWTNTGRIGCATSTDGINWTKCSANPVLGPGNPGTWDEVAVHDPVVVFHNGIYHMWYRGTNHNWTWHIGYVTSTNGITWIRFLNKSVLSGTNGEWDEGTLELGDVLFDGTTYHMWYGANSKVGYAASTNGITWTKSSSNPVLSPGTSGRWGQPVVKFTNGSDGALLSGFMIKKGEAENGAGIYIEDASPIISECIIAGNTAYYAGGGVYVKGSAFPRIIASHILSNTAVNQTGGGVAVMDGASITLTTSTIMNNFAADGAGISIRDGAAPFIADNDIISNTAKCCGGGLRFIASGGMLQNNRILSNTAGYWAGGAMEIAVNSWTTVVSNSITNNRASSGGGIAVNWYCTVTITGNEIISNSTTEHGGGGVLINDYSRANIDGNVIANNTAEGGSGVVVRNGSIVTVTNNVIASNKGLKTDWSGDGIVVWGEADCQVKVINNTFAFNSAEGVQADDGTVLVRNNIFYGNGGGIHNYQSGATASSDHNAFWNNDWDYGNISAGPGDISADPLFVDAPGGDYHLQVGSPCINAGTPEDAPVTDIEGTPRDVAPDIGAYEWIGVRIYLPITLKNHSSGYYSYTDSTTSAPPSENPDSYIYTGYSLPYATPRSIEIYWPLSSDITSSTIGTSTFKFWGKGVNNPVTHLYVNGHDIGLVNVGTEYGWCTISFDTAYLDQGDNNVIEIWTNSGYTRIASDAPEIDDVGQPNKFYVRNNGGTSPDGGPYYGRIYAQLTVEWEEP